MSEVWDRIHTRNALIRFSKRENRFIQTCGFCGASTYDFDSVDEELKREYEEKARQHSHEYEVEPRPLDISQITDYSSLYMKGIEGPKVVAGEKIWPYRWAVSMLPDADRVLEIGCGGGHAVKNMLADDRFGEVKAVEIVEARARHTRVDTGIEVEIADLEDGLWGDIEAYDLVLGMDILEHMLSPEKVMNRAWEVLKPGGRLVAFIPLDARGRSLWYTFTSLFHVWKADFFDIDKKLKHCGFVDMRYVEYEELKTGGGHRAGGICYANKPE